MALAGGSDALSSFTLAGFNALQALDGQPCRPFCQTRAGLNLGEGAAMLLLEDADHARARGAAVLAWLSGWAFSNDAFHPTAPDEEGRGLALSMELAMQSAGVGVEDVGLRQRSRHRDAPQRRRRGEGLRAGLRRPDRAGARLLDQVAHRPHARGGRCDRGGDHAPGPPHAVRSFPLCGWSSPIETSCVDLLRSSPRRSSMEVAMSVSAGFGGSNASLVFQRSAGTRGD